MTVIVVWALFFLLCGRAAHRAREGGGRVMSLLVVYILEKKLSSKKKRIEQKKKAHLQWRYSAIMIVIFVVPICYRSKGGGGNRVFGKWIIVL